MLDVGDEAPGFTLPNQDGDPVSLTDFAGQPVVVYFYPRADTPGCTTEACGFRDTWSDYEAAGAVVLGISDDPVDDLAAFREKYDLPFDLLSDEDGAVASAYDSYGEKSMFGKTFDGVFRNTYLVDGDGRIAAVYPKVDPEGHAAAVLDDVAALP
jgi:peroxiredoxin Q/BCP